jgi:hypothetical protein
VTATRIGVVLIVSSKNLAWGGDICSSIDVSIIGCHSTSIRNGFLTKQTENVGLRTPKECRPSAYLNSAREQLCPSSFAFSLCAESIFVTVQPMEMDRIITGLIRVSVSDHSPDVS